MGSGTRYQPVGLRVAGITAWEVRIRRRDGILISLISRT